MKRLLVRVAGHATLAFLWTFQWLPLSWQAACGRALGALLWPLAVSRRRITLRNLELCLPDLAPGERHRIGREVFQWYCRSILEHGLIWYAPASRLERLIRVEGDIGFADRHDGPVMWLMPHFMGLGMAGVITQLKARRGLVGVYQHQTNPVLDDAMLRARLRRGRTRMFARDETVRPVLKAIREGYGFLNLPDMDYGPRDAAFVPFFGVPAATLVAPSRMARTLGMAVQPVVVHMLPGGQGYAVRFFEPWTDFPGDDPVADAERMNRWVEGLVRECPAQYYWVHKRFKTRPPGEPSVY